MDNTNVFVQGMIIKAPHQNAPDFVKGSISMKKADLIQWLNQQEGDWVNADIKVSKGGKWYVAKNTWKPEKKEIPASDGQEYPKSQNTDEIPF